MADQFSRTRLLLGDDGMKKLFAARVAVFGLGGVGGYACEALARAGVGHLDLIDHDTVSLTNLNRQIIATHESVGMTKTDAMAQRLQTINPDLVITKHEKFFLPENASEFPFDQFDYILDAVDTVTAKLALVQIAQEKNIPIISAMGTGNKLDPSRLRVADIQKTDTCPLARVMRRELHHRGIRHLKVVYSDEEARMPYYDPVNGETKGSTDHPAPGSTAFVPAAAGLLMASAVVRDLISE